MSECRYKPLFGRVVIKREAQEKHGSIIIVNAKKHAKSEGIVAAVGPTAEGVKVGDHVIFGRHSGAWLDATYSGQTENDDGTFFICQDEDLLAIIDKAA
jgi:co-chaperonin GroES (HSP10)